MKKRIDETLILLIMGILAFGLLCQVTVIWFIPDKIGYSIGLWIGIVLATAYAYHIWWSLAHNLTVNADNERGAAAFSLKQSILRYAVVAASLVILWYAGGNTMMLAGFLGIMGVKAGAYFQPLMKRIFDRYTDKEVGL